MEAAEARLDGAVIDLTEVIFACEKGVQDRPLRTDPGSEYSVKGRMGPLALLMVYCSAKSKAGQRWYYGRASLDSNGARQTTGWVWSGGVS